MERAEQIVPLGGRNRRQVLLPLLRKQQARAELIEPGQLELPQQEDAAQHELADGGGMRFRVRERERAAPRAAEHEPAVELQMAAQALHVGDEVPGRVGFERGMRAAPSRAALVEDDDSVASGIEEPPRVDVAAAAGPAVHEQGGLARGVAGLLVVHLVAVADGEIARVERLDRRILRPVAHASSSRASLAPASAVRAYTHSTRFTAHGAGALIRVSLGERGAALMHGRP